LDNFKRKGLKINSFLNTNISGLSIDPEQFEEVKERALKMRSIIEFKEAHPSFPLMVVVMGGTGTGKSTIFNGLLNYETSITSVERPATSGGIFYCPEKHVLILQDKILSWWDKIRIIKQDQMDKPLQGEKGVATVISHCDSEVKFILIDSPDMDSLLAENRQAALDLYLLADLLVFVSSMEKYADDRPVSLIKQAKLDKKEIVFVLNKVTSETKPEKIGRQLKDWGLTDTEDIFTLKRIHSPSLNTISSELLPFKAYLSGQVDTRDGKVRARELSAAHKRLKDLEKGLEDMLSVEREAYNEHNATLNKAFSDAWEQLNHSLFVPKDPALKRALKSRIKEVYHKYDILSGPRRILSSIIKIPLRVVGILLPSEKRMEQELKTLHTKVDLGPLLSALTQYQLYVAQGIKEGPLNLTFGEDRPEMGRDEAKTLLESNLKGVEFWLNERFQTLKKGIPRHKRVGMYSLSMAWGILIVGIESVTMGGLSILELAIDATLAPFITGGAMEIFILNELKTIARELNERYMDAVKKVLMAQHKRYLDLLEGFEPK